MSTSRASPRASRVHVKRLTAIPASSSQPYGEDAARMGADKVTARCYLLTRLLFAVPFIFSLKKSTFSLQSVAKDGNSFCLV